MNKILTSTILLFAVIYLQAQNLYVQPVGGGEQTPFALADKPKITFGDGTITIDGTTFQLTDIQNLSFVRNENQTNVTTLNFDGKIFLFPNPVQDELQLDIRIPAEGLSFRVFDINGRLMRTEKINSATTTINVQDFRSGIYIFKIDQNGKPIQSFRIIKQ